MFIFRQVLDRCGPELAALERDVAKLEDVARGPFPRITYAEAAKILEGKGTGFTPRQRLRRAGRGGARRALQAARDGPPLAAPR